MQAGLGLSRFSNHRVSGFFPKTEPFRQVGLDCLGLSTQEEHEKQTRDRLSKNARFAAEAGFRRSVITVS